METFKVSLSLASSSSAKSEKGKKSSMMNQAHPIWSKQNLRTEYLCLGVETSFVGESDLSGGYPGP